MSEENVTTENEGKNEGEFRWITSANGLKLHARTWKPEMTPRALVIVLHGFSEHLGLYEELAEHLVKKSFLVFGHDYYGFGRSEGTRAGLTKFGHFVEDVISHIKLMKEQHPDLPVYAVAHSMGGTLTLKTFLTDPSLLQGMVLIGPAIIPSPIVATPGRLLAIKVLSTLMPNYIIGKMEYDLMSRDQDEISKTKKDPYRWHNGIRAKFASEFLVAMKEITKDLSAITCPLLTIHGEKDKVVDVSSSKELYEKASSKDKTLKIHEKAYHSLLLELPEWRKRVLDETTNWIDERVALTSKY